MPLIPIDFMSRNPYNQYEWEYIRKSLIKFPQYTYVKEFIIMEYIKYYDEIVKRRESCRNFIMNDVEQIKIDALYEYYNHETLLVPEIATELKTYSYATLEKTEGSVGYNGFLIKAPNYLVIFSEEKDHYLENAGFIAQGLTLKMTQLDLAACWLTINDADIAKKTIDEDSDKTIAAIIAFGYRNKDVTETRLDIKSPSNVKMIESGTKAAPKISLDDLVSYKVYGQPLESEKLYAELESSLLAASKAQSFLNRQPYRLILDDSYVYLIGLEDEITDGSDMYLNYGILMFNFYAVMDSIRANAPLWTFETPDEELKLPEGGTYIAKCRI